MIMDIRLPDGSGIEACREIRSQDPNVKVINLTREYYPQVVVDLYGWLGITPNPDLRFTLYNKNARIVS